MSNAPWRQSLAWLMVPALAMLSSGCEREARRFSTPAHNSSAETVPRDSGNQPGLARTDGVRQAAVDRSPYERNAHAVAQGKRLYTWFNCNGCHAGGGGGIGPPLMDNEWRYGSDPASLFDTIVKGRPNGMPSYGGHIPDDQVWQIVAYVQSMSGGLRADVAPSRSDTLFSAPPENARPSDPGRVRGAP
jgi:cytochrome c oxidase cbb3-type subunit III